MEIIHCVNGGTYTFSFDGPDSQLRFVVPMRAAEQLNFTASWDVAAKVRVICQSPGGEVIFDRINECGRNFISKSYHECEMDGPYSLYLLPLMIPNQHFQGELALTSGGQYESRRWPIIFLIDCSSTMDAQSMAYVRSSLAAIVKSFRSDPQMLELAYLSTIAFDSDALVLSGNEELMMFQMPILNLNPFAGANLNTALRTLLAYCDNNIVKTSPSRKGDMKPGVLLFSNFLFPQHAGEVLITEVIQNFSVLAFLTSEQADVDKAKRLTESILTPISADQMGETVSSFFRIHSEGPIEYESVSFDEGPVTLPPPPPKIVLVD